MAVNSTLLAIQCASGVAVSAPPRCGLQLRRNLVTKTHKTTIMAAANNPAVLQYEAGALVSIPISQPHTNLVTKRDKTITAAYPINKQYTTDIPDYTEGTLKNISDQVLKLYGQNIWEGSQSEPFPQEIQGSETVEFKQYAVAGGQLIGSVGGLEYVFGEGGKFKWIIAWSNSKNELNKVYTQILEDEVVNWNEIRNILSKSEQHYESKKNLYKSDIVIDQTSATPKLKATLSLLDSK